jgi:E3 ubiquitin-protein ligase HERC2
MVLFFKIQYTLRDKLKYAIHFCKSIDSDEYARVAMPGSVVAADISSADDEEDDDLHSAISDGPIMLDYPSPSDSLP